LLSDATVEKVMRKKTKGSAIEAETEAEVEMKVKVEAEHEVIPDEGLNDAQATSGAQDDILEKMLEKMNGLVELLKTNDVMREAIGERDAKAEEGQKAKKADED
jgi:hypothetical protein